VHSRSTLVNGGTKGTLFFTGANGSGGVTVSPGSSGTVNVVCGTERGNRSVIRNPINTDQNLNALGDNNQPGTVVGAWGWCNGQGNEIWLFDRVPLVQIETA